MAKIIKQDESCKTKLHHLHSLEKTELICKENIVSTISFMCGWDLMHNSETSDPFEKPCKGEWLLSDAISMEWHTLRTGVTVPLCPPLNSAGATDALTFISLPVLRPSTK